MAAPVISATSTTSGAIASSSCCNAGASTSEASAESSSLPWIGGYRDRNARAAIRENHQASAQVMTCVIALRRIEAYAQKISEDCE